MAVYRTTFKLLKKKITTTPDHITATLSMNALMVQNAYAHSA